MDTDPRQVAARFSRKSVAYLQLIELLVRIVPMGDDDKRQHRDKIIKRVNYGMKKEEPDLMAELGGPDMFVLDVERAAAWARTKWDEPDMGPARFVPPPVTNSVSMRDVLNSETIPGDIDRCQAALTAAYARLREMRNALRASAREIDALRPDARVSRILCNRDSGLPLKESSFEADRKLVQRGLPVTDGHRPFLADVA